MSGRPKSHLSEALLILALVLGCAQFFTSAAGCTPIAAVTDQKTDDAGSSSPSKEGGRAGSGGGNAPLTASFEGSPCDREGARLCTPGNPSRQPLECTAGLWQPQAQCSDDQRCEVAGGPDLGRCVAIMHECAGRTPGQEFCDGQEIHTCTPEGTTRTVRPCGAHQMCSITATGAASCVCKISFVPRGDDCEQATTCAGGCDALTPCHMQDGKPACDACPPGFAGSGSTGCIPLLSQLQLAAGLTLAPAFDPGVHAYRVHLPLSRTQLVLSLKGPSQAKIEVNGKPLDALGQWHSQVLPLGEHPVQITLTSSSGAIDEYQLIVERTARQEGYLKARDPEAEDSFGIAIDMSGDTVAVGATSEDGASSGVNGNESNNGVADSGATYVFVRDGAGWSQQAYLKADAPTVSAWFGKSVALDGDTLFVGEPRASPYFNSRVSPRAGSVYRFVRQGTTWTREAIMKPESIQDTEMFGFSMAFDKDTLVISAPYENTGASHSGAVYVATRADGWSKLQKLKTKQPLQNDTFGWAVAIHGDTMLVGAPQAPDQMADGPGHAHVFERQGGEWTETQILTAPMPEHDATFGFSVSVHGDRLLVGAPRASVLPVELPRGETYAYQRVAGQFSLVQTLTAAKPANSDFFGSSVRVSEDSALVCSNGDSSGARGLDGEPSRRDGSQSGAFYQYGLQDGHWVRSVYGKADNAGRSDMFGFECLISGDSLIVSSIREASGSPVDPNDDSASNAGAVYVFR